MLVTHFLDGFVRKMGKHITGVSPEAIQSMIRMCNGRVRGAGGAAQLLKLPPTTLQSKLKKFGIR